MRRVVRDWLGLCRCVYFSWRVSSGINALMSAANFRSAIKAGCQLPAQGNLPVKGRFYTLGGGGGKTVNTLIDLNGLRMLPHLICSGINPERNCASESICTSVVLCQRCMSVKAKGHDLSAPSHACGPWWRRHEPSLQDVKCLVDIWPDYPTFCAATHTKTKTTTTSGNS